MDHPLRVTILADSWADTEEENERHHALRTVGAALSLHAEVDVMVTSGAKEETFADGAFEVQVLPSPQSKHLEALFISESLRSSGQRPSAWAARRIAEMEHPVSEKAVAALARNPPDVLVAVGDAAVTAAAARASLPASTRMVYLPLRTEIEGRSSQGWSSDAELVLALGQAELEELSGLHRGSGQRVVCAPLPITVSLPTRAAEAVWVDDPNFIVVLRSWPPTRREMAADGPLLLLAQSLSVTMLVVEAAAVTTRSRTQNSSMSAHLSRVDIWRMMSKAIATVDLRQPGVVEREVLESMMFATPVIVPAGGRRQRIAELSDGGLWFRSAGELVECVDTLTDAEIRSGLGSNALAWATEQHGSTADFADAVASVVLGTATASLGR